MVTANDMALRSALASVCLESGWDAVTFSGVAKRAGLTVGAVYGRADSIADLGADIWESDAGPWLRTVVAELVSAAEGGRPDAVKAAYAQWLSDTRMAALCTELLIASLFDPDLGEVVLPDAREILGAPTTPTRSLSAHHAAAGALVLFFALGRALAATSGHIPSLNAQQARVLSGYFAAKPMKTSAHRPPRLDWRREFDAPDPQTTAILRATLDVIGRVGYRRATISRIARAGQVPRGSVLSHFDSKIALVAEAAHQGLIAPMPVWLQYAPVVEEFGPLMARAMFLRDFLAPDNAVNWAVNLELSRLARVEPSLAGFRASENVLEHTHLGVMLLAAVVPGLDELPFAGPFMAGSAT